MRSWKLNRAGLFNYWFYDEEEFHFSDGKLLLRGANGSGKSVTMQSFFPLLLDGRKSPERLDPFGSKSRRIEDYLLCNNQEERTGYLYLEYVRDGLDQYMTTGIGLRAKKHGSVDFWGFVIKNNQRIGHHLQLYKQEKGPDGELQKVPLNRKQLEETLRDGGIVVRSQKEYMELVNRYVFGFPSLESYEELIKLLIQIRSPKLSKDFKPTVIYEILVEALPPLTDEELRPLTESIEAIDQIQSQLDQLVKERSSLDRLLKHYTRYNQVVLKEKAEHTVKALQNFKQLQKKYASLQQQLQQDQTQKHRLEQERLQLHREREVLGEELEELKDHDVYKAERDLNACKTELKKNQSAYQKKENDYQAKKQQQHRYTRRINELEAKLHQAKKEMDMHLDEMKNIAEESLFLHHDGEESYYLRQMEQEFSFTDWKKKAKAYRKKLVYICQDFEELKRAEDNYEAIQIELGKRKKEWDDLIEKEHQWKREVEAEKQSFIDAIYHWNHNNQEIWLDEEQLQTISQIVLNYPEDARKDEWEEIVRRKVNAVRGEIQQEFYRLKHELDQQREIVLELENELSSWEQKEDPEPNRHTATDSARKMLKSKGIPFLPFYRAVDFHPQVTEEERKILEAALSQTGILDSLILPSNYESASIWHDQILVPAEPVKLNLSQYLKPTPPGDRSITAEDIEKVLQSIGLQETEANGTIITIEGHFRNGLVQGHAIVQGEAIYIGRESRQRYREQMIQKITAQLQAEKEKVQALSDEKEQLQQRINQVDTEYQSFPGEENLNEAYHTWFQISQSVIAKENELNLYNRKQKETLLCLEQQKSRITQKIHEEGWDWGHQHHLYQQALSNMEGYLECLEELQSSHYKFLSCVRDRNNNQEWLNEIEKNLLELKGELNELEDLISKAELRIQKIQERLQELGFEEIQEKVRFYTRRLEQEIPQALQNIEDQRRETEVSLSKTEDELDKLKQSLAWCRFYYQSWMEVFKEEKNLQGLWNTREQLEAEMDEEAVISEAKQIIKEFSEERNREDLERLLNNLRFEEQSNLFEYDIRLSPTLVYSKSAEDILQQLRDETMYEKAMLQWKELQKIARRNVFSMSYEGMRTDLATGRGKISEKAEQQEQLLENKDKELYQEVILNSIGRIIRSRITRAENWIKEMNRIMDERNPSSSLKFSLQWKPKTAGTEAELDTKELVHLLSGDSRILKDEDLTRIRNHFQVKINQAREQLREQGGGDSFHQLIKKMLDYRDWYQFVLYAKKEHENRKEMTNHVFEKYSGGEKAMAMYIPLFAAAYSRYSSANKDAPKIIALDEAFAGVDENNIADLFDVVEKLGFNYVMNSQALWGDYDKVKSLSICEIVRPKNAPFVTVMRYHWNGHNLELSHPGE
ncbi:TIGR02680 family protein [Paenactinomyces guangxiensis]|uniref:TIGR02680 family protein n=1 Tax=Paenactinomyces guangxiensis TaxID=1490290 RepID=A0A7W1WP00_9BACL|nr:TIGR02680 family protein [Paenactinomyces guangxiensis]MBA4493433.1 TIGR02680 family protein [Paenactinomyces guangxiensis]MBH8590524.1 TIGR02680 family protein [Paenactinomyces guangxiensis]